MTKRTVSERVGAIADLVDKKSASGDSYTIIEMEGVEQGFFDWDGHVEAAGVAKGDTVRLEFSPGEYPRVEDLKKMAAGNRQKTEAVQLDRKLTARDGQIARQCALKAAAAVLQGTDLEYQDRATEVVVLAEMLERWILR